MNTVTVKCKTNTLIGKQDNDGVISFLGVPFAQPPVGELRWQIAQPLPNSDEVRECFDFGNSPMQEPIDTIPAESQSEDCLYLNIWAADVEKKNKPVMLWVYGGSFVMGSGSQPEYHGQEFIKENPDIILICTNYRVGLFGTFNLSSIDPEGKYKYSNNNCILDVRAALRWINENIEAFGGDSNNIMMFGQSAGSNNITANMRTPESRKYCRKIACQSSFNLDISATSLETSQVVADFYLKSLGSPANVEEALAIPAEKILEVQSSNYREACGIIRSKLFSPVVDDLVLHKDDLDNIDDPVYSIIGTNSGDYDRMATSRPREEGIAMIMAQSRKVIEDESVLQAFLTSDPERDLLTACLDLKNDLFMRVAGTKYSDAFSKNGCAYHYFFDWHNPDDPSRTKHGDEIPILFHHEPDGFPEDLAKGMRQAWINLARYGDPNNDNLPHWDNYTIEKRETMVFDNQCYMSNDIRPWDNDILRPYIVNY